MIGMLRANPIFSVMHVHCRFDRLCILDRRTSPAPMPATVMAKEGAGLGIVGAITLGAGSGLAAFHRCISLAGRKWGRGQRGFRRGRASVQNVRIGIVECDRARLLNGCLGEYWCQCHRRQKRCRDKSLNKVMVGFPVSTDARILGRSSNNGSATGRALWGASFSFASVRMLRCLKPDVSRQRSRPIKLGFTKLTSF
jgi:hypothetical protein